MCERAESPGPIFREGAGISAWSEVVGDPYSFFPILRPACTTGWPLSIFDERIRIERGTTSQLTFFPISANTSSWVYSSVTLTSTVKLQTDGTTLCCWPA